MSTPSAPVTDAKFAFELVKLLLQVAWADDDIAPAEAEALLAYAGRSQLSAEELQLLAECLAGRAPLPAPNLGLLKTRRVDVLRAVRELLLSDLRIAADEEALLEQVAKLLT